MENLTTTETNQNWSHFQKIAFRFCFIFFALHNFTFPISDIPVVGEWISEQYENLWDKLVNWGGKLFFGIPEITIKPAGSGDTTWNWVQEFLILLLSALCCVLFGVFLTVKDPIIKDSTIGTMSGYAIVSVLPCSRMALSRYSPRNLAPLQAIGFINNWAI
jgi:hypothetical protein